jgi:protocatechuate 3,4-dioxygenase beta subunit
MARSIETTIILFFILVLLVDPELTLTPIRTFSDQTLESCSRLTPCLNKCDFDFSGKIIWMRFELSATLAGVNAKWIGAGTLFALWMGTVHSAQFPSERFPLPPNPSTLEGTVVDAETGKPLAGITVVPPWPSSWTPPPPVSPSWFSLAQTDANGHFVRDNIFVDNGHASVGFYYTDDDSQYLPFTIAPGQRLENIVIRRRPVKLRTGLITGRVRDENGKGVANIQVELYRPPQLDWVWDRSARTDDRGEFRLYGLKPGRYLVGYSAGLNIFQANNAAARSIPATLYPGVGEVSRAETVIVEDGMEVRLKDTVIGIARMGKLRVHIINRGESAKDGSMGTSDGSGGPVHIDAGADFWREYSPVRLGLLSFTVSWTSPGGVDSKYSTAIFFDGTEQSLEVDLSRVHGVLSIRTRIDQADGSTAALTANTVPGIILKSRSNDDRDVNTRVAAQSSPEIYRKGRIKLKADGSGDFTDLVTGSYSLEQYDLPPALYIASARQGERDALADGIDISNQPSILEIHLRQDAAVFRGKVSDAQGQPMHAAAVFLIPELPQGEGHRVGMWVADATDQDGHFEITGIIPGRYLAYAAFGVDWYGGGGHTLSYVDPEFVASFRDRAIPVTFEANGELTRDLRLLAR